MKKLILLLVLAFATFAVSAQREISDTIQGAETVAFDAMVGASQLQVLCTELGGTSDGSLILKGSVDGVTFVTITETDGSLSFYPNDTLTVADAAVWLVSIKDNPFNYYQVSGTGTASDTTLISIEWAK